MDLKKAGSKKKEKRHPGLFAFLITGILFFLHPAFSRSIFPGVQIDWANDHIIHKI
jgi:hypothetical protein